MHVTPNPVDQSGGPARHWQYLQLRDIEVIGDDVCTVARLYCEEGEGGPMVVATCTGVDFPVLELYAQQLLAWREDPIENVQPDVPIVFPAKGNARLYAAQARKDHPELEQVPTFPSLEFVADVVPGRVRYTTLGRARKVSREEAMKIFGVYARSARRI